MQAQLSLNIWSILFLIIAGQGMFLFFLITSKKGTDPTHKILLGTLISCFSIMLCYYAMYWSGLHRDMHPALNFPLAVGWAIGPITLLYLKHIDQKKITPLQLLQLIPFVAFLLLRVVDGFLYFSQSMTEVGFYWWSIILNLQFIHIITYAFIIVIRRKHIRQHQKWADIISISYGTYALGNFTYYVLVWTNQLKPQYDYLISFFMAVGIYAIGYYSHKEENFKSNANMPDKYGHSLLPKSIVTVLSKKLDQLIFEDQIHLQHDLNLDILSEKIGASKHQVSQLINEYYKLNFFDFINRHRVHYAQSILKSNRHTKIKINDLAVKAGFNNKVTFNKAFKKFTGMTATQFRNSDSLVKL